MLGSSCVAAQLAAPQEGLNSVSKFIKWRVARETVEPVTFHSK
jgi:hypothetical protein